MRADETGIPPSPFGVSRSSSGGLARLMGGLAADVGFGVKIALALFVLGVAWTFGIRFFGFKSDIDALKHIAAGAGCEVALMIDAAPRNEGEPGYWKHLDIDQDTVSCDANDPAVSRK